MGAQFKDLRGVFADGWTQEMARDVLPVASEFLGLRIVAVWPTIDYGRYVGGSTLYVAGEDGRLYEQPRGLMEFLCAERNPITPSAISRRPGKWTGFQLAELRSETDDPWCYAFPA